jgi:hypothetical protein
MEWHVDCTTSGLNVANGRPHEARLAYFQQCLVEVLYQGKR